MLTVYQGHVLDVLAELPEKSIDCIVTSPPYWALRAYSTVAQVWGDGWRGELGLEPSPEMYVDHMVEVFRALRRVLSPCGTLWLNMGDSYVAARSGPIGLYSGLLGGQAGQLARRRATDQQRPRSRPNSRPSFPAAGLKSKDLVGMPWRVALALQADGWWLRSDIVWYKPNPMPESVHDRPTRAHEYVFLLTRSAHYAYDAEAISEPVSPNTHLRVSQDVAAQVGSARANGGVRSHRPLKAVLGKWPSGWASGTGRKHDETTGRYRSKNNVTNQEIHLPVDTRNARSVWTINTAPYPEAHFATFPEELPRRAILAGCPPKGVVLDPFAGSGTTLDVANALGRQAIGIELSSEYVELIRQRCDAARMDEWNRGVPIVDKTVLEGPLWAAAE